MEALKANILGPLSTRIGTSVSFGLAGYGVAEGDATILGNAVVVLLGLGIDLMLAWFRTRDIQRKASGL